MDEKSLTLADVRAGYESRSKTLSEVLRQLAFAGLATVWVMRSNVDRQALPGLLLPATAFISGLAFDLLQYAWASAMLGSFHLYHENRGIKQSAKVDLPNPLNWPTIAFLWIKVVAIACGYYSLLDYMIDALLHVPK